MVMKNSVAGFHNYRSYQRDQEHFDQDLLIQLLLSPTEADELLIDQSALQLAQQQLDHYAFAGAMPRRRVIPPRRHLRNK